MSSYRYYFIDRDGSVLHAENIEAPSDDEAKLVGTALLAKQARSHVIEVWGVGRRISIARRQ
jgi:hypothetical protein